MKAIAAQFETLQILNENGEVVNEAAMPELSDDQLKRINASYGVYSRIRSTFYFFKPSRTFRFLRTYSWTRASQLASHFALEAEDFILPGIP
ncbi:hypothetical protein ACT7DF_21620 [Bacillus cereus]